MKEYIDLFFPSITLFYKPTIHRGREKRSVGLKKNDKLGANLDEVGKRLISEGNGELLFRCV